MQLIANTRSSPLVLKLGQGVKILLACAFLVRHHVFGSFKEPFLLPKLRGWLS